MACNDTRKSIQKFRFVVFVTIFPRKLFSLTVHKSIIYLCLTKLSDHNRLQ